MAAFAKVDPNAVERAANASTAGHVDDGGGDK
jgi:hypothetical protein